jgi:hypothetical protein
MGGDLQFWLVRFWNACQFDTRNLAGFCSRRSQVLDFPQASSSLLAGLLLASGLLPILADNSSITSTVNEAKRRSWRSGVTPGRFSVRNAQEHPRAGGLS